MTASGTTVYPGLYKARCTADNGIALTVFVPQVFGTQAVTILDITGGRPQPGDFGYIMFEGGDTAFPIWLSSGGGAGGTTIIESGGGTGDLDGGAPDSVYGGLDPIDAGTP
jgi:hypothetical protein